MYDRILTGIRRALRENLREYDMKKMEFDRLLGMEDWMLERGNREMAEAYNQAAGVVGEELETLMGRVVRLRALLKAA